MSLIEEFLDSYPEATSFIERNFIEVIKDYNKHYNTCVSKFNYKDEEELNEIFSELYSARDYMYEVDFDNERVIIPQY